MSRRNERAREAPGNQGGAKAACQKRALVFLGVAKGIVG